MLQSTIVLCAVLALSNALPQEWHQSVETTTAQNAEQGMQRCKSVVAMEPVQRNGVEVNISRSYHICTQEDFRAPEGVKRQVGMNLSFVNLTMTFTVVLREFIELVQ